MRDKRVSRSIIIVIVDGFYLIWTRSDEYDYDRKINLQLNVPCLRSGRFAFQRSYIYGCADEESRQRPPADGEKGAHTQH